MADPHYLWRRVDTNCLESVPPDWRIARVSLWGVFRYEVWRPGDSSGAKFVGDTAEISKGWCEQRWEVEHGRAPL